MLRPGSLVSWQLYQTVGVKLCTGALNIPREAEQTWRRQQSWDCRSYRLSDLTTGTVRIAQPRPAKKALVRLASMTECQFSVVISGIWQLSFIVPTLLNAPSNPPNSVMARSTKANE